MAEPSERRVVAFPKIPASWTTADVIQMETTALASQLLDAKRSQESQEIEKTGESSLETNPLSAAGELLEKQLLADALMTPEASEKQEREFQAETPEVTYNVRESLSKREQNHANQVKDAVSKKDESWPPHSSRPEVHGISERAGQGAV